MDTKQVFLAIFCVVCALQVSSATLTVSFFLTNATTNGTTTFLYPNDTIQAPRILRFGGPFGQVSGQVVLSTVPSAQKAGQIVLAFSESGWSWDRVVRREYEAGAKAVICVSRGYTEFPGGTDFIFDGSNVKDLNIPVVEIIRRRADLLHANLTAGVNLTATITCCDANPWDEWNKSGWMWGFSVIVGGYALYVFLFGLYKFTWLLKVRPQFNVSAVTLVIVMVGNCIRAITNVTDPILSRRTFPNPSQYVLLTITWPFTTIATLVITFYWLEVIKLNKKVQVSNFLSKLFWPFIIAGTALFSVELASSISRGLDLSIDFLIYFSAALYVIIDGVVTVIFWWMGWRVMQQLKEGAAATGTSDSKRSARLSRATKLIMLSVVGNVVFIIVLILGGFTSLLYDPIAYSVLFMLSFIGLTTSDLCKVLALRVPKTTTTTAASQSGKPSVGSQTESTSQGHSSA